MKKGAASARSDDTKSLKGAILDWITPKGQPLSPSLARNVKIDRGYHHERTGALLCPAGLDWSNNECVLVCFTFNCRHALSHCRVKEKLRNGEMVVQGDQWPLFLYHGYVYDDKDPWNGLLRSSLLVTVCRCPTCPYRSDSRFTRPTNISLHPPVLSIENRKPLAQVMPAYTA
jgi:hypothetical protein